MRVLLIPISTRRTFLYAQRLGAPGQKGSATTLGPKSAIDRATAWATRKWADWEHKPSGWQRKVVDYGNHAFRRIPYQEWGLKSITAAAAARNRRGEGDKVQLAFPGSIIPVEEAEAVALKLATERLALHRSKMIWCFVAMPITIPFALVPVIPNLPFFYLVYRAWSHWRAILGGKQIRSLVDNKLVELWPSSLLDQLYQKTWSCHGDRVGAEDKEEMLLTQPQVREFCETLDVAALEIELERAIWQVEKLLQDEKPSREAKAGATRDAKGAELQQNKAAKGNSAADKKRQ
ncbi:hypothetical protein CDD82_4458 [Ophiocordyceps australis]|uniref:Uncharacterized protein n=1 Tax=Ophiocordyceps australis TaxID=1399860 RepID=A0A2C5Z7P3_9HYPO|nr:hypothetical protein CDD82_4458 [Ophiocordyceps australis]